MSFVGVIIINTSLVQLTSSIFEMGKHTDHNYVIALHNITFPFRKEKG